MTQSHRAGLAAVLVGIGLLAGVLLTTGLEWTPATLSQERKAAPRQLLGAQGEVPADLQALESMSKAFVRVAEIVNPSVVTIASERVVRPASRNRRQLPEDHPFREFFGEDFFDRFWNGPDEDMRSRGLGSGVIVSEDGYILTNNHVVAEAEEIEIQIIDGRELQAEVIGADKESDLALVKVKADNLPAVRFGDSDKLAVGEWVVAVGSPFSENLDHTVTAGIVSAKGRTRVGIVDFEDFIQTDAAINPGNSGGALVNLRGELVGINTAIATRSGFYQGVGFAIPVNMARKVMDDLLNEGKVVRGWLGVVIQSLDEDLAASLGLDTKRGVVINDLTPDGPAAKAGIRRGDVILEFEGTAIKDADHLQSLVAARDPGSSGTLRIRRDGKDMTVKVGLGERPTNPAQAMRGEGGDEDEERGEQDEEPKETPAASLGFTVTPLTTGLARELDLEGEKGVVVQDVDRAGAAAEKNIRRGDLILEVNRKPVGTVKEFEREVKDVKPGEAVLFLLRRGETTFFTAVKAPEKKRD